jgi:hypothetical protein
MTCPTANEKDALAFLQSIVLLEAKLAKEEGLKRKLCLGVIYQETKGGVNSFFGKPFTTYLSGNETKENNGRKGYILLEVVGLPTYHGSPKLFKDTPEAYKHLMTYLKNILLDALCMARCGMLAASAFLMIFQRLPGEGFQLYNPNPSAGPLSRVPVVLNHSKEPKPFKKTMELALYSPMTEDQRTKVKESLQYVLNEAFKDSDWEENVARLQEKNDEKYNLLQNMVAATKFDDDEKECGYFLVSLRWFEEHLLNGLLGTSIFIGCEMFEGARKRLSNMKVL